MMTRLIRLSSNPTSSKFLRLPLSPGRQTKSTFKTFYPCQLTEIFNHSVNNGYLGAAAVHSILIT